MFPFFSGMTDKPNGAPMKGVIQPQWSPSKRATSLADLLVDDPNEEVVLVGPHTKFSRLFYGFGDFCSSHDLELITATMGLAELAAGGNANHVALALANRKGAVEALVRWAFRTPQILPDGVGQIDFTRDRDDTHPEYRAAPQQHPRYAMLMAGGPLPLLKLCLQTAGLRERVTKAKEHRGLLGRLQELSQRRGALQDKRHAFHEVAVLALQCLELVNSSGAKLVNSSGAVEKSVAAARSAPAAAMQSSNQCAECGEEAKTLCGRCGEERYCSRACQVLHWTEHRDACTAFEPAS